MTTDISELGTIKIGTVVKNYVGWYRNHGKWRIVHAAYDQKCQSQPSPLSQNSMKTDVSGLGSIKIGTAVKNDVGWYWNHGK